MLPAQTGGPKFKFPAPITSWAWQHMCVTLAVQWGTMGQGQVDLWASMASLASEHQGQREDLSQKLR